MHTLILPEGVVAVCLQDPSLASFPEGRVCVGVALLMRWEELKMMGPSQPPESESLGLGPRKLFQQALQVIPLCVQL